MSIALIITRGYGNGTFTGTIKDVVTRGYSIAAITTPSHTVGVKSRIYATKGLKSEV